MKGLYGNYHAGGLINGMRSNKFIKPYQSNGSFNMNILAGLRHRSKSWAQEYFEAYHKLKKVTMKEQLKELKEEVRDILERIENLEKDNDKFVKGKWYKWRDDESSIFFYNGNHNNYGVDEGGYWGENTSMRFRKWWTPATDSEVEEMLIKEAKKRGFKSGVRINRSHFNMMPKHDGCDDHILDSASLDGSTASFCGDGLSMDGSYIFYNGKWAEIIKEVPSYTMSEAIEKLGHEFKIKE